MKAKRNTLVFFSRPETRIVLILGLLLLFLSNYFIQEGIKSREAQRLHEMNIQSVLNKQLVEENMALMFQSVYLQRAWIENRLAQKDAVSSYSWLVKELSYDGEANLSTLDHREPEEEKAFGNIIVKGDINEMAPGKRAEVESLSELFDMQRFLKNKGMERSWSTYFSPEYILIYPFKEGVATMNGEDGFFKVVEDSLLELNKAENAVLYETGWEVGIDFDITGTVLMFAKYLPVKKGDAVVGAICDNIAVEDLEHSIAPIEGIGLYLVDPAGSVIYDNGEHIQKVMNYYSVLKKKHGFNGEPDLAKIESGTKNNGHYYFVSDIKNAEWEFLYVVPADFIEISQMERRLLVYATNGILLLGIFLILWLLFRYHKKALEIEKQKDQFLANISHDLKSPLASILGFNTMLEERFREEILPELNLGDSKTEKTVFGIFKNIATVQSEGRRLASLINDLLDVSVLYQSDCPFLLQPCKVDELLRESCEATRSVAGEKGLEIKLELEEQPGIIMGDRERILQVLHNLLSNGIKFTDCGYIRCSAVKQEKEVLFCIEDTGIGIPLEDREKIFDRFSRSSDAAKKKEGTGLGLSICRSIVEKHSGKIWVESKDGQGSRFCFTLPLAQKEGFNEKNQDRAR